jgi:hypothetical protein
MEKIKYSSEGVEEDDFDMNSLAIAQSKAIVDVTWFLQSTLSLLVRSLGGHVEESDIEKAAQRLLCGLASQYVDGIVLKASDYWDIAYERKAARP